MINFLLAAALAAAPKTELSVALNAEFETLNPVVNSMMAAFYVYDTALRPLVALPPEGGMPYPVLLVRLPTVENKQVEFIDRGAGKPRGLKVRLEILPRAQWGDGTPLTCHDVRATWEIGRHPNVSVPARSDYTNIEDVRVDAKDPKICDVVFTEAKSDFYLSLPRPLPAHLEGKVFEKYKDQPQAYERQSLYVKDLGNPGLYNGPYRIVEHRLGGHVALVRNEKFHGPKPFFAKLIFKFILNTATLEANLRSGNIDMASSSGFTFDQALAFEKKVKAEKLPYDVLYTPASTYARVAINLDHPVLSDVKVRKAMALSLNKKELAQAFFEGRQRVAHHFSTPLDSWFTENPKDVTIYDYSRRAANKVLDEAGWVRGKDGVRAKGGKRLALTIVSAADTKLNELLEAYLQQAWKQIGLELSIKNYPARVLFGEILRQRKFELGLSSSVSYPDPSMVSVLHSKMIPSAANSFSGVNRAGWRNTAVDGWLDAADVEFDRAKKIALMKKVLAAYTDELPELALYYKANNAVIPRDLKGFKLSGHFMSEFLQIENWSR